MGEAGPEADAVDERLWDEEDREQQQGKQVRLRVLAPSVVLAAGQVPTSIERQPAACVCCFLCCCATLWGGSWPGYPACRWHVPPKRYAHAHAPPARPLRPPQEEAGYDEGAVGVEDKSQLDYAQGQDQPEEEDDKGAGKEAPKQQQQQQKGEEGGQPQPEEEGGDEEMGEGPGEEEEEYGDYPDRCVRCGWRAVVGLCVLRALPFVCVCMEGSGGLGLASPWAKGWQGRE